MDFMTQTAVAGAVIPFVMGLLKKFIPANKGLLPVLALVVGLAYGAVEFFIPGGSETIGQALMGGAIASGIATGLYDLKKGVVKTATGE